jgi:hypothetical protein
MPAAVPPVDPAIAIPAGTRVVLELQTPVSTKTAKPGDAIAFVLRQPLLVGDRMLTPVGAQAGGQVVHSQKAGGFGKAGELLLSVKFVESNGVRVALKGLQPLKGADRSRGALAMASVPYAGLFAGFIRGGQIDVPAGTPFIAKVGKPVAFAEFDLASLPMAPVAPVAAVAEQPAVADATPDTAMAPTAPTTPTASAPAQP